jgi:hypothetical protein
MSFPAGIPLMLAGGAALTLALISWAIADYCGTKTEA